jgi:hypothetical protein
MVLTEGKSFELDGATATAAAGSGSFVGSATKLVPANRDMSDSCLASAKLSSR